LLLVRGLSLAVDVIDRHDSTRTLHVTKGLPLLPSRWNGLLYSLPDMRASIILWILSPQSHRSVAASSRLPGDNQLAPIRFRLGERLSKCRCR
jgi:hypothetical protein